MKDANYNLISKPIRLNAQIFTEEQEDENAKNSTKLNNERKVLYRCRSSRSFGQVLH